MPVHEHGARPYEWVGALSERRAKLSPDRVGLVDADTGEEYTYRQLDERANRTARLLRQQGVDRGDRVVVVSRNRPELVDLYFATAKIGAVLAPLSHRLAPPELAGMLEDVEPGLLVVEAPVREKIEDSLAREDRSSVMPPILHLPTPESDGVEGDLPDGRTWTSFPEARPADDSPVETADLALSDPHLFLHTGGSTGLPKEVVLSHGAVHWNAFNTIITWGLRPDDLTPMVFPMFHTGGWNVLTIPLFHLGATVVIARDFDPEQVLDLVEAREATVLVGVPAVLRFMVESDEWEGTDLSSLRFVKSGGGPCRDRIIRAWRERGIDLSQGYGLTECGPNNFAMPDDFPQEKTDSIGMPCLYVDGRVVDEGGRELDPGEVGELELASPHAGDRYWRAESETESTFGARSAASESTETDAGDADADHAWVSTGDLARIDEDGYFYIEGRKKNMFVSGGENVYPPEVENVVTDHPKVQEAIVVPVADETWGQVGKAVVQGDESLTIDGLREFMEGRIASFKIPRDLAFVKEMPIGGAGKIDRQQIEDEFGGEDRG